MDGHLAYSIDAGNVHDSQAFLALFEQLERLQSDYLIADSGYKTPSIAKFLLDQNITPVFPYTRPRGKKGKLRPKDFIYDDYYDCYLCPENQVLAYSTTNHDGYREYKSDLRFAQFVLCYPVAQKVKRNRKSLLAIFGGSI